MIRFRHFILRAKDNGNYSYKGKKYSLQWLILFTIPTKTYSHHIKNIRYKSQHPHSRHVNSSLHIKRSSYRLLICANTEFHTLSPSRSLVMDIKERNHAATDLLLYTLKKTHQRHISSSSAIQSAPDFSDTSFSPTYKFCIFTKLVILKV
jgi:hypothetical protein